MKRLLIAGLAIVCAAQLWLYTRPVEKIEVKFIVTAGDTLWNMVGEAIELTGDKRYILEVLDATIERNGITSHEVGCLPIGREIIIPCEVIR